ncbi:PR domain zinc finger protein 2 [Merluccius polli]|uniref:PR domain zinc finger protein 2 n=1 Tax=Merluccius polli TaxID=89951 RepID=A0AA47M6J2_MERPO|nr:PR domain zinc finger protein 2 [Merluccius polli]
MCGPPPQTIPKGKSFGPFVVEEKKRSQVSSNVYVWEVYYPARGWMSDDAIDPMKGELAAVLSDPRRQRLAGRRGAEDNPEITAAREEEREKAFGESLTGWFGRIQANN